MVAMRNLVFGWVMLGSMGLVAGTVAAAESAQVAFDIDPKPLNLALTEFARQSGLQVVFVAEIGRNLTAPRVSGSYTPEAALQQLLVNTPFAFDFINPRTVTIHTQKPAADQVFAPARGDAAGAGTINLAGGLARVETPRSGNADQQDGSETPGSMEKAQGSGAGEGMDGKGIPEILVRDKRTSNTDIRRTEDDVQPYVVFDAEQIEQAMSPDLESFLKTRLPMNQVRETTQQNIYGTRGHQSTVNLRGLGANQTLILVNGRRMPGIAAAADFVQPDINGIPLSAVERIEILPSTAGGIYGGGATGGVVNIILKRNYSDLEMTVRYDGSFDGGGAQRRIEATGGFSLFAGRTNVMATASYQDANPLYAGDRDFAERSRALQISNNPGLLYDGTTPVRGYTTNFRSVSGNDLVLLDGMRSLNSPFAYVPEGYPGPALDNGLVFLSTAGQYNLDQANDLVGSQRVLLSAPEVKSVSINARHEFTRWLEMFVDVSRYENSVPRLATVGANTSYTLFEGPANPFTESIRVTVPMPTYDYNEHNWASKSESEQAAAGFIVRLPRDWTAQLEYVHSRSEQTFYIPFAYVNTDGFFAQALGDIDPLSDVNAFPVDYSPYYASVGGETDALGANYPAFQNNATLRLAGPLLRLPGGPLRLSALVENREQFTDEQIEGYYIPGFPDPFYAYYPEVGSRTNSAYAELTAPLVAAANARPGLLGFDVQISYRHDQTTTRTREVGQDVIFVSDLNDLPDVPFESNTVNGNQFTLGFRYTPVESLALRVSFAEGILPPSSFQLSEYIYPSASIADYGLFDPLRGEMYIDGTGLQRLTDFGNLQLQPEHSQSWSAGLIFTPDTLPGLRMSLDYTRIEKTDEITPLDAQTLINLGAAFPDSVVRDPLTPADQAMNYTGGVIRELNLGNVNVAESLVEAFDMQADYIWQTELGEFGAHAIATYQPHLRQQAAAGFAELDSVGYLQGPLKWRANAGLHWTRSAWTLGWNMQYYDKSRVYRATDFPFTRNMNVLSQGAELFATQTYHDVFGRFRFGNTAGFTGGLLEDSEVLISVQNVLNDSPPIVASGRSPFYTSGYSPEGDPRLRRYSISLRVSF